MPNDHGWEPVRPPRSGLGRDAFVVTAFTRLARTHACSAAGDGAVAVALAGSLFFSADPNQAKWRVVLYLALTLAPFSIVAPLIGPAIDRARGGARWIIIATCLSRALVALLMVSHIDTFLLFPEAFAMLVMGKGYAVAKSAYLPTTVNSDAALVGANSKLAMLSAIAASAGAAPAALMAKLGGAEWAIGVAMLWFMAATYFSSLIPAPATAPVGAPTEVERAELSSAGVRVAASAMGMLRGAVGFLTLWIAFELRQQNASPFEFGVVLGPIATGAIVGSAIAPRIRKLVSEEQMLIGALGITAAAGVLSAFIGGLKGAALIAAAVAIVSSGAKQAFDSLVQRDAPHADHGRAFAQYEARFQILWVLGALLGVLLPLPLRVGFGGVGVSAIAAVALFFVGRRALQTGGRPPRLTDLVIRLASEPQKPPPGPAAPGPGDASAPHAPGAPAPGPPAGPAGPAGPPRHWPIAPPAVPPGGVGPAGPPPAPSRREWPAAEDPGRYR